MPHSGVVNCATAATLAAASSRMRADTVGWVVFSRYDGASIELWRLDLASGREQRLTSDGAVNVEPRQSPDPGARA